jgi:hypothetical protein
MRHAKDTAMRADVKLRAAKGRWKKGKERPAAHSSINCHQAEARNIRKA